MRQSVFLYFVFIFVFICSSKGQDNNPNKSDTINYFSFEKAVSIIENKYHVRFFYDTYRLNTRRLNRTVTELPFDLALDKIQQISGYSSVKINTSSYILIPVEDVYSNQKNTYQDFISIGNPLDYGKYASGSIEGELIDGKTGEPLVGAMINVEKLKIAVTTDKNGKFILNLPVGEHELNLKYFGYEESNAKIKVFSHGKLKLELFEKSISLDEVIVRAEMAQSSVMRNQMSIVRIDSKAIKELPVTMGETDVIKSVTLMPGVQSVGEFGSGFNVRGGSADQNLVLMEDLPVFNPSHVFGLISVVNSDDVSNVTLLKAGIPVQYGERVSSVLDIKMGGAQAEKISAKGGIGLINSRLSLKMPLLKKNATLTIGGRSSYSDWLLHQMPDIDLQNSSAAFYDLNAMLAINPNSTNRISIYGYLSNDDFTFTKTTRYRYENLMGGMKWSHVFTNNLSFIAMVGRSNYDLRIDEDMDKNLDQSKIKMGVIYDCFRTNVSWAISPKNSLNIGVNAIRYTNNPGELSPGSDESLILYKKSQDEQGAELSAYLSDNYDINDKFSVEAGVRYTKYLFLGPYNFNEYLPGVPRISDNLTEVKTFKKNDIIYSNNSFEPRVNMIYKVNSESSVKASYSKVSQFMNLISNTSVMAPTDVWKLSDGNISPLVCQQFALGYYRNFSKKALEASVEIYFKQLQNVIEYKDGAKLLLNQSIETDLLSAKGYNYGIEFYVRKNTGRLTGWVSYTYSRSLRKTASPFQDEQIKGNQMFPSNYDKPNNLIILTNYHISRRWRFSSTFVYSTGRPVTLPEMQFYFANNQVIYYSDRNKYRLPDYHRLDVSITLDESLKIKKKWKGSWTFSIVNLYGRKNAYSAFYAKETPSMVNDYRTYSLYKLYIIGQPFPTLTYNFYF
jgi:hypothetical protein